MHSIDGITVKLKKYHSMFRIKTFYIQEYMVFYYKQKFKRIKKMEYFLETSETIKKGVGFKHFDSVHLSWLIAFILITIITSVLYRRGTEKQKKIIRYVIVALLFASEAFKWIGLIIGGNVLPKYLPFQLCSINIFLIAIHAVKPFKVLDNFLYAICIPASLAALLFPTWTKLPFLNFMNIHSVTIHMLLALYPIVLTAGKSFKLEAKQLPKCIVLLLLFAIPAHILNSVYGTNFMFLESVTKSNPLYIFEKLFGEHLIGYPVIAAVVFFLMYFIPYTIKKIKQKRVPQKI